MHRWFLLVFPTRQRARVIVPSHPLLGTRTKIEDFAPPFRRAAALAVVVRAARPQKCVATLEQSNSATAVANAWWPCGVRYAVRVRPPTRCTTAWHRPRLPR